MHYCVILVLTAESNGWSSCSSLDLRVRLSLDDGAGPKGGPGLGQALQPHSPFLNELEHLFKSISEFRVVSVIVYLFLLITVGFLMFLLNLACMKENKSHNKMFDQCYFVKIYLCNSAAGTTF